MRRWKGDQMNPRLDRFSNESFPAASVHVPFTVYWSANNAERTMAWGLRVEGGKRWAQARLYWETYK